MIDIEEQKKRYVEHAVAAYERGDQAIWVSSAFCAQVAGNYERGATLGLAARMNKSVDTVEAMAHAYDLYSDLKAYAPKYVRNARKTKGIYLSHFRALYDTKNRYGLDLEQTMDLLVDIVQAAMTDDKISSRDVEAHAQSRFGLERPWFYYANKTMLQIEKTLGCPDLPTPIRKKLLEVRETLTDKSNI